MDYQCIIVYTVITILPPRYEIEDVSSRNGCFGCIKKAIKRLVGTNLERAPPIGDEKQICQSYHFGINCAFNPVDGIVE
ncbi:hypothetical protein V9T40_012176 [Parthenolecanium corni]|uniref:Uncharacterized protein n=1 Tax=Parthenolecanium corni TaxID=536013 RepID=A0AAN9T916_9HEMI